MTIFPLLSAQAIKNEFTLLQAARLQLTKHMCSHCNALLKPSKIPPLNIKVQTLLPETVNPPGTFPALSKQPPPPNPLNIYHTPAKLTTSCSSKGAYDYGGSRDVNWKSRTSEV